MSRDASLLPLTFQSLAKKAIEQIEWIRDAACARLAGENDWTVSNVFRHTDALMHELRDLYRQASEQSKGVPLTMDERTLLMQCCIEGRDDERLAVGVRQTYQDIWNRLADPSQQAKHERPTIPQLSQFIDSWFDNHTIYETDDLAEAIEGFIWGY